jgi:hypothetical protein
MSDPLLVTHLSPTAVIFVRHRLRVMHDQQRVIRGTRCCQFGGAGCPSSVGGTTTHPLVHSFWPSALFACPSHLLSPPLFVYDISPLRVTLVRLNSTMLSYCVVVAARAVLYVAWFASILAKVGAPWAPPRRPPGAPPSSVCPRSVPALTLFSPRFHPNRYNIQAP